MSAVFASPSSQRPPAPPRVRALVVDENAAARSAVKGLLLTLGIEAVQQAADPIRAIRLMEVEAFDLVLCDAHFRSQMDGSQVLEYVRTRRLLAPSAAFVLMGAEAMRSLVAQAREWQPDGFVLKPLTAAALGPRIEQALRRRRTYAPLYEADDRGDAARVLEYARGLAMEAGGASVELLRWQAQALVDLGRFGQAREICEQAIAMRADLPWAAVALAHCERHEGRLVDAVARLRATIRLHPSCGEAYDLLIDVLQEQGHVARALAVAKSALEQLSTTQRLRALGEIALAQGEFEQAEECYAELVRRTSSSLTRSPIDTAMLGQVFVSRGAADKALRVAKSVENEPDASSRALAAAVQAQAHSVQGDPTASEEAARRALTLATASEPPESVLLLVAHGAFAAGLHDEGRRVAERAVRLRRRAKGPGALARKVLADAGIEPEAFAKAAAATAPRGDGAPVAADDGHAVDGSHDADRTRQAASTVGAGEQDGTGMAAGTPAGEGSAADDVAAALAALHGARFDDALRAVTRAREKLPHNPMVLMAAVQVQLLRMRARGHDAAGAADVRACLAELDAQIPGDERVLPSLAGGATRG
ncbi:MAG: hypothetical protein RJA99_3956 [Pseudomonadota bacterium]|jgi:tetratricopeptide (TPR) repeat protein